jgi:hypothetical protein
LQPRQARQDASRAAVDPLPFLLGFCIEQKVLPIGKHTLCGQATLSEQERTAVGAEGGSSPIQQVTVALCGPQLDSTRFGRPMAGRLCGGQNNKPKRTDTVRRATWNGAAASKEHQVIASAFSAERQTLVPASAAAGRLQRRPAGRSDWSLKSQSCWGEERSSPHPGLTELSADDHLFLKTIIPSRKAQRDDETNTDTNRSHGESDA